MTEQDLEKIATDLPRIAGEITDKFKELSDKVNAAKDDAGIAAAWRKHSPLLKSTVQKLEDIVPTATAPPAGGGGNPPAPPAPTP